MKTENQNQLPEERIPILPTLAKKQTRNKSKKLSEPFRGYSFYHKYSEKQLQSLKKLLLHLANKHSINIRQGLPNLIKKKGMKAFDITNKNMCLNSPGVWSHGNVVGYKDDVAPQVGMIEMLLEL